MDHADDTAEVHDYDNDDDAGEDVETIVPGNDNLMVKDYGSGTVISRVNENNSEPSEEVLMVSWVVKREPNHMTTIFRHVAHALFTFED